MNRKTAFYALMALWFLIIASYTAYKELQLRTGDEVMLRVMPVDPRDIFRGDYIILYYEITSITEEQKIVGRYGEDDILYNNEKVYIMLLKDGKYYKGGDIYKTRPEKGLFIAGTVSAGKNFDSPVDREYASIIYGIENFFVAEGEGKEIESAINRNKVSAKIVIDTYGNASIKELYIDEKKVDFKNKNEKID
ncbi:MAG: GDYXXLXY domain-containing protein [Endomicrobium sp.]|jgi:uncharacterized membrane-anchored protein|nr:GDYXXLXY domain-containing protein [Endomicrobium sp.]